MGQLSHLSPHTTDPLKPAGKGAFTPVRLIMGCMLAGLWYVLSDYQQIQISKVESCRGTITPRRGSNIIEIAAIVL